MRKFYLMLLPGLFSAMALSAQITIDGSDIPPFGAVLSFGVDTIVPGLAPGPAGGGQSWDFSGLSTHTAFQNTVVDPAETPFGDEFTDADFSLLGTDGFYSFAQLTNDALLILGGSFPVPGGTSLTVRFDAPQQLIPAPATFGSSFERDFGFYRKLDGDVAPSFNVDSIEVRRTGTQSAEIDAWGEVALPSGTYEALRQRIETITIDSISVLFFGLWIDLDPMVDTTVAYEWWAKDGRSRVLSLEYDGSGNPLSAVHLSGYSTSMTPPVAAFSYELLENGEVQFTDESEFEPVGWLWDFGDGANSLEQNPSHTYAASGVYEVCLTVANGAGQDEICQNVDVVVSSDEEAAAAGVRAFPSPFTSTLAVELGALAGRPVRVLLFNSLGQPVKQERVASAPPQLRLPAAGLRPGIYRLVVETGGERVKVVSVVKL
ncbi:MAG: PKD domain-containing protein [Lewinellaceae bacterium]|nr:PKD domain-containing protein [Lewinellaceae bacterium]